MPLDAVSNFVRGSTDAAVDSTQTSVSVVNASIFPDPATDGEYNVVIWDVDSNPRPDQDPDVEILRVTAIDTGTNTLTVTRGQETTAGASHPSGSAVHLSPTAKMFGDIESTFNAFYDDGNDVLTSQVGTSSSPVPSVNADQATIAEDLTDPAGVAHSTKFVSVQAWNIQPAYTSGPAHGEGVGAFQGAAPLPDGRVVLAPYDSSNVGLFDPATDSYTSGPAHGEGGGAFIGAAPLPDGRVVLAPLGSSNVGLFDPATDSYTSGPAHGEGVGAFRGAAPLPDGRVVLAPFDSSNVGLSSPYTVTQYPSGANR